MRKFHTYTVAIFFLLVAALGHGADFAKGQKAYNSGDYDTAHAEWLALANDGNADGQYGMGLLYANGFGVDMIDAEALKWYSLAAEQGHAEAMYNIAVMHANGWGVPQSDAEAFNWYGLAAERGSPMAQFNLARMLCDGYFTVQDPVLAYKWYSVAAEMGASGAASERDELAKNLSATQIQEADRLTNGWMERFRIQLANKSF